MDIDHLLQAYQYGIFPMARSRQDETFEWIEPVARGIIPLNDFHIPKSLKKFLKKTVFFIRFNTCFDQVMNHCAAWRKGREDTWINSKLAALYSELHQKGFAHSVECFEGSELVGGLYGVALGGAFFGESMFSLKSNASKMALVYLVKHLCKRGFTLLDTQFLTPHLAQFGAIEISQKTYHALLAQALKKDTSFDSIIL